LASVFEADEAEADPIAPCETPRRAVVRVDIGPWTYARHFPTIAGGPFAVVIIDDDDALLVLPPQSLEVKRRRGTAVPPRVPSHDADVTVVRVARVIATAESRSTPRRDMSDGWVVVRTTACARE
jgi:hypothetical protein